MDKVTRSKINKNVNRMLSNFKRKQLSLEGFLTYIELTSHLKTPLNYQSKILTVVSSHGCSTAN